MPTRECRSGHLVTDDSLDFCPECAEKGATVLLSPQAEPGSRSPAPDASRSRPTDAAVGWMFAGGGATAILGAFIANAATTDAGKHFGWAIIAAGGSVFAMALIAIAVSLGIRMSRD